LRAGRYKLLTAFIEKVFQRLKEREDFIHDKTTWRFLTNERNDCKGECIEHGRVMLIKTLLNTQRC
jgi:hypothetical protein